MVSKTSKNRNGNGKEAGTSNNGFLKYSSVNPIQLLDDTNKVVELNNFIASELPTAVLDAFLDAPIAVSVVNDCREFNVLADLWLIHNEGIPASNFPKMLIRNMFYPIGKMIEELGRQQNPSNPAFTILFKYMYQKGHGMTAKYSKDNNGGQRLLTELAYYYLNGSWPSDSDLNKFMSLEIVNAKEKEKAVKQTLTIFEKISGYLKAKVDNNTENLPKVYNKEDHIICYFIMCSLLIKRDKRLVDQNFFGKDGMQIFNWKALLLPLVFLDSYTKWINAQRDPSINTKDFTGSTYNTFISGTFPWSRSGTSPEHIKAREDGVIQFLMDIWPEMQKRHVVKDLGWERLSASKVTSKFKSALDDDFENCITGEDMSAEYISDADSEHWDALEGFASSDSNNPNNCIKALGGCLNKKKGSKV